MTFHGEFVAAAKDATDTADTPREPDTFGFYGEVFAMRGAIGAMTLMQFAAVAVKGVNIDQMEGLAAVHRMLEDCIAPGDWPRFQEVARREAADAEDLLAVIRQVIAAVAGRPTVKPSASPDGPSSTMESSRVESPSPDRSFLDGMVPVGTS